MEWNYPTHPLPPDGSLWYCVHCGILPLEEAVQQDTAASGKEYCRDCGDIGHDKLWNKEHVYLPPLSVFFESGEWPNYINNNFYTDWSVLSSQNNYLCSLVKMDQMLINVVASWLFTCHFPQYYHQAFQPLLIQYCCGPLQHKNSSLRQPTAGVCWYGNGFLRTMSPHSYNWNNHKLNLIKRWKFDRKEGTM